MLFGCLLCLKTTNIHYSPLRFPTFCFFLVQSGQFSEDMIPTVGFNMRKVTKGNVTIKVRQRNKGSRWTLWIKSVSLWTSGVTGAVFALVELMHVLFSTPVLFLLLYKVWLCNNNRDFSYLLQIWDIGGQPRFRSMWERYCRGVNAIV